MKDPLVDSMEMAGRPPHPLCASCRGYTGTRYVVNAYGPNRTGVLVLCEKPSVIDDREGVLFSPEGEHGRLYRDLLGAAGLKIEDVNTTALVRCHCQKPADVMFRVMHCEAFMFSALAHERPVAVITLGQIVTTWVLSHVRTEFKPSTMEDLHGHTISVDTLLGPMVILPMYSISACLHKPTTLPQARVDWIALGKKLRDNHLPRKASGLG